MSGKEVHELSIRPITCFSFNKDCSELAFSPNDNTVHIYKKTGNKWEKGFVLTEDLETGSKQDRKSFTSVCLEIIKCGDPVGDQRIHGQRVTGIAWAPNSNRLVTCGADRNAYVWNLQDGKWKPMLVILRINRAASYVCWSPKEDKFAVGSSARLISVCYFEKENDWWVSKHIKKPIRSTVLCLDWHPNNLLLAAGSSDFKTRVFSAYIKEVDGKANTDTIWGKKSSFGSCLKEFSNGRGGWVHGVSFSASGNKLAWVGHDSSISVVNAANECKVATIQGDFLPFAACVWVTENSIITAGYDNVPILFRHDDNDSLSLGQKLDVAKKKEDSGTVSAMAKFRTLDKRAQSADESGSGTGVNTTHQNAINHVQIYSGTKAGATKFATSGVDGRIVIWDVKTLESSIAGLKIS